MRRKLSLNRQTISDLATDELSGLAGGITGPTCVTVHVEVGNTPTCPVRLSYYTECQSFPINDCLITLGC